MSLSLLSDNHCQGLDSDTTAEEESSSWCVTHQAKQNSMQLGSTDRVMFAQWICYSPVIGSCTSTCPISTFSVDMIVMCSLYPSRAMHHEHPINFYVILFFWKLIIKIIFFLFFFFFHLSPVFLSLKLSQGAVRNIRTASCLSFSFQRFWDFILLMQCGPLEREFLSFLDKTSLSDCFS